MQKWTLPAIKKANAAAGFFYWEKGADAIAETRTLPYVYQGPGGIYLVEFVGTYRGALCEPWYRVLRFDPATGKVARSKQRFTDLPAQRPGNHIKDARAVASLCAREGGAAKFQE